MLPPIRALCIVLVLAAASCRAVERAPTSAALDASAQSPVTEPAPAPPNDAIVICGQRVHTGTTVVLWTDPPYYDAYQTKPRFSAPSADGKGLGPRLQPGRVRKLPNPAFIAPPPAGTTDMRTELQRQESSTETLVPPDAHDPALLRAVVDQFVLHFDVCGLSRTCFRVLQDERILSVQFMLDIDGTIYQTMDVRETAWHATKSNPRSIGIEMANMGAYGWRETLRLDDWYKRDGHSTNLRIPPRVKETGLRSPGFAGHPARDERVVGTIQGELLYQYDFTPEQYASLVKLAAVLCRELPKIAPDAPRDEDGHVLDHQLSDEEWTAFGGILGHYHVQTNKNDPGPAFDWDRFLADVCARMTELGAASR